MGADIGMTDYRAILAELDEQLAKEQDAPASVLDWVGRHA